MANSSSSVLQSGIALSSPHIAVHASTKMPPVSTEGKAPYVVPSAGKDCYTWYKVFGNLGGATVPLIALHGGPGSPHNYLLSLADLSELYGIPVILYDQLGCGNSTALPEKWGDQTFFNSELFERELDNLVDHLGISQFDLLGHSWGGMLAAKHASNGSHRLGKLILMNTPASIDLFIQGIAERQSQLPQSVQDTIERHKLSQDFSAPEYTEAMTEFYKKFWCRCDEWPADLIASRAIRKRDPTVVQTMSASKYYSIKSLLTAACRYGPTEFSCTGSIKGWTALPWAHEIKTSTLLLSGEFDEVIEAACVPYFEKIPKAKWVVVNNASHMMMWEQREQIMRIISNFLRGEA